MLRKFVFSHLVNIRWFWIAKSYVLAFFNWWTLSVFPKKFFHVIYLLPLMRIQDKSASSSGAFVLVGRAGLEPATNGLKGHCSTN